MIYGSVAVAIPSRGLIHSRTIAALQVALNGHVQCDLFMTHDMKIPDAQNYLVALIRRSQIPYRWILFVEEDVVVPPDLLDHLKDNYFVQAVDYPLVGGTRSLHVENGEVAWCGLGCTLVAGAIFAQMEEPWFQTDQAYSYENGAFIPNGPGVGYGGQDIGFSKKLRDLGIKVYPVDTECRHLRVAELGAAGTNDGCHKIIDL